MNKMISKYSITTLSDDTREKDSENNLKPRKIFLTNPRPSKKIVVEPKKRIGKPHEHISRNLSIDLMALLTLSKWLLIINTLSKVNNNRIRTKLISIILNKNINSFDGTVSLKYFNSPYKWYKIIEDINERIFFNDSEDILTNSTKGKLETIPRNFPIVILEGDMQIQVFRVFDPITGSKPKFLLTNSEDIPMGCKIRFHKNSLENIISFTKFSDDRYKYEGPIIPYKIIKYTPKANIKYPSTYLMEGCSINGFPLVGKLKVHTSVKGKIFKSLISSERSDRVVYNSFDPKYVLKVERCPYTFEGLLHMRSEVNPFVPESIVGVVQNSEGFFYKVTKLEKVAIVPKIYTEQQELQIATYLISKGWQVYKNIKDGTLDLAIKDGIILEDIDREAGNVGFTTSGEVKIIDLVFNKAELGWSKGLIPW